MKTLALDLDSGKLARWVGDPRPFPGWSDRYGDLYTLRVHVYRGSGGRVPSCELRLLVKEPAAATPRLYGIWGRSPGSRA